MLLRRIPLFLLTLFLSTSLFAAYTITPASGPTGGGTTVTITGEFGNWPYQVLFGDAPARSTTRVNQTTLVAVTPDHLPGPSAVRILEGDVFLDTALTFTFEGTPTFAYEGLLLPVFSPPVSGAFGSRFVTDFEMASKTDDPVSVFGLAENCVVLCIGLPSFSDTPVLAQPVGATGNPAVEYNGTPGRFIYVRRDETPNLAINLRVYDESVAATNFGTEMPVPRFSDFDARRIVLLGVPTDDRFRNLLRIYGFGPSQVTVTVEGQLPVAVFLPAPPDIFTPAYATFSQFPVGVGEVAVTIDAMRGPSGPSPVIEFPIWGFITVTNNELQTITTITPKP